MRQVLSESSLPLVPYAPMTGFATGGDTLTPEERDELNERIDAVAEQYAGGFGIAVQDLRTGATYSYNPHAQFPTASVAKLTILTMLLIRAEEEGRDLSTAEQSQAAQMIRYSDNEVTDDLYDRIGFTDGFNSAAEALGFTGTDPNTGGTWGSTMTTPADQLRLLRALYTDEGPLTEESRAYVRELMESVAPEQVWGVAAAAGPDDTVGLKNGWTPREDNEELWTSNSVGYVAGPEREYLIAVLSDGNTDYSAGVQLTETLVTTVTGALEDAAGSPPT